MQRKGGGGGDECEPLLQLLGPIFTRHIAHTPLLSTTLAAGAQQHQLATGSFASTTTTRALPQRQRQQQSFLCLVAGDTLQVCVC